MARVTPLQENFNAGEFGARMAARVGFDKYQNAGSLCENILPLPQGGFTRRPGFRYIADAAQPTTTHPWLIPFVFSTEQAYILELGEYTMRYFRNQAPIVAPPTDGVIYNGDFELDEFDDGCPIGWTDRSASGTCGWYAGKMYLSAFGSPGARAYQAVTTTTGLNVENVLRFQIVGELGGAPGDSAIVRIGSSAGAEDYYLGTRMTGWHTVQFTPTVSPYYVEFENATSGKTLLFDNVELLNDEPVELPTPWDDDISHLISYAQSADVLYLCAGDAIRPYRLERYGHSSWSVLPVLFEDGPWNAENTTSTTLTPASSTGYYKTVTASSVIGINQDAGFRAKDLFRLIRIKSGSTWGWAQIVEFNSTTQVKVDVLGDNGIGTSAVTTWRLGEWNDSDGWPAVVGFIQQRLGFAASTNDPQKFWLSKSAATTNFQDEDGGGTVQDDSAISYRFAALQVNTIRWMASRKKPVIGTQGGNWTLRSDGAVLTPTDISADFEVSGGVARLPPLEVRSRLLFAQAQGRKLVEFADVLTESGSAGYDAFDLTLLNDRVLTSGIRQMAFAQEPDSVVWIAREDGQLATLTYQPEQNVVGWARQIHGGTFLGGAAVVETVAVIPGQDGAGQFKNSTDRYEVWVGVKMTINGTTSRFIECMERNYNGDEDLQQDAFYVDSGLTLDNPITITGITQANPGVVTAPSHGFVDTDLVRIVRVDGMVEVNETSYKVANATTHTFELTDDEDVNIDTSAYTTYAANGEVRPIVTTVSGLDHLEGEVVKVFGDSAVQVDKTVSSGSITLEDPAALVHVGLGYDSKWRSLKLAYGAELGSAVGQPKNIADITLVLMETGDGSVNAATVDIDGTNVTTFLELLDADEVDGGPVPFYTGEKRLGLVAGYDADLRLELTGDSPSPFTVLGVVAELDTEE